MIDAQDDCQVVFEEENASAAIERAPEALIDVLIVDHRVRGMDGIHLIEKLIPKYHEINSKIPAIILTGPYFSRELLIASIAVGATDLVTLDAGSGELLKAIRTSEAKDAGLDFDSLRTLVESAADIKFAVAEIITKLGLLSENEPQVLELFKQGKDDDQIAAELNLPKYRVRQAMIAILNKCNLATRAQLFLAISYEDRQKD